MTQETQIWAIYKIINLVNGKIYIGQTIEPTKRWYQHRRDAAKPKYPLHFSIKKHGVHNFEFEVIFYCKSQDDANWAEEELIKQCDSLVKNGKGYNISLGGMVAPKSAEWIQAMKNWHASLSPEERAEISKKQSEATISQIATKGHPAQGRIVTEEERELHRKSRLENPLEYTPELRKKMSESHIGIKDSEETKQRKSVSIKENWDKRNAERLAAGDLKCNAFGCEISGLDKSYKIIDGIRYCNKHGLRLERHGTLDKLPPFKYTEDNPMPDDVRKKCGIANIGRVAHNRKKFTKEQIESILSDNRSNKKIAKDLGVTEKVIKRVKLENVQ